MEISLSAPEAELVLPLINERISDYYMEIRHAMVSDFKDQLKERKAKLIELRDAITSATKETVFLSKPQIETLAEIVQDGLHQAPAELHHTDNLEWRERLKKQLDDLRKLQEKLTTAA